MKLLFVTDTHLGLYNDSDEWLNVVKDIFVEIKQICKKEKINTIIHGGDFFHNTRSINKKTLDYANYIVNDILHDIKLLAIIGNHDIFYKNKLKPNSLQLFEKTPNVQIIEEPTKFHDIYLIPWNTKIPDEKLKYCFGHFEINGFQMNDSFTCDKGMNTNQFKNFKSVYSGHFHKKSTSQNITYLGSPFQQTFADENNERGFHIWNNGELIFIRNIISPEFHKIEANDINSDIINGNIIKLIFNSKYDTNETLKIIDKVKKMKPMQLSIDLSKTIIQKDEAEQEVVDTNLLTIFEIFKNYTDIIEVPKGIQKKTLLKMSKKLIDEIVEQ